jgi:hypothetical protein
MNTLGIVALLATLALGAVAGFHYLMRTRSRWVVTAHLVAAIAALAVVAARVVAGPAGPMPAVVPLLVVALALAGGYGAFRWLRRGGGAVLGLHVAVGAASFLVFLAYIRVP